MIPILDVDAQLLDKDAQPPLAPGSSSVSPGAGPEDFGRIVVTGGAGFIGSHLVRRLADCGATTVVVDIAEPESKIPGVTYVVADLRIPRQAENALAGANVVFHLAGTLDAPGSLRDPAGDFEANVVTTLNVLRAARAASVQRFVFSSSALVYGLPSSCPIREDASPQPEFPYAESKHACERLIAAFGKAHQMSYVIGRTFVTYGPGEPTTARAEVSQFIRVLKSGSRLDVLGNPDAKTRDFVHVFDVVEALILLAGRRVTGIVNIGTGRETSLRELAGMVAAALGRPALDLAWVPSPEDECRLVPDISRLRSLGYRPSIGLEDGIAALAARFPARAPTQHDALEVAEGARR
jgi:UDP-glucose 4-epimerase